MRRLVSTNRTNSTDQIFVIRKFDLLATEIELKDVRLISLLPRNNVWNFKADKGFQVSINVNWNGDVGRESS